MTYQYKDIFPNDICMEDEVLIHYQQYRHRLISKGSFPIL